MNGGGGGESRPVHHQITTPATTDREATTTRGVRNPDDGTGTSGTTVHHLHLPQRKCVKTTDDEGQSDDMTQWRSMLENTQSAENEQLATLYIWSIGVWVSYGVYGLAPTKNTRPGNEFIGAYQGLSIFIYTHCLLR